ncbi:MAG: aspartate:alanine exchanger family transporter [Acidobacteriota bacterium]
MVEHVLQHPVGVFFLIVAIGSGLGKIRFANITLGASGVLFVGLLFGHYGYELPVFFQNLGIILFVYAIGLQAGPRFFNQFRSSGLTFAKIGIVVVFSGAAVTWILTTILGLDPALGVGMFAGALTSTPGLAAAMDAAGNPAVGVGYGLAYPFGVIGVVLFIQVIPRILRINLSSEEKRAHEEESRLTRITRRQFRVTNPACIGKSLADLRIRGICKVTITRLKKNDTVIPAAKDCKLELSDVIMAVGTKSELEKLKLIVGEEASEESMMDSGGVVARDVMISNREITGRTLRALRLNSTHKVVVSRVFRENLAFTPDADFIVEVGDMLRVIGDTEDVEKFVTIAGQQEKRVHETNIAVLALGISLGVLLAYYEFVLPGGIHFRLGLAGGPLFVSLILAHFGRIGRLNIRTPRGAKHFMQQLGLALFLAGAGVSAGGSLASVVQESGVQILAAAMAITLLSCLAGLLAARFLFKQNFLAVLGAITGAMTSTPALGVISDLTDRSEPFLAYSAVYPVALILMTICCQVLVYLL